MILVGELFNAKGASNISAFSRNGSSLETLFTVSAAELQVSTLVVEGNDIIFGTGSIKRGSMTRGVWRIKNGLKFREVIPFAEQIVESAHFTTPELDVGSSVMPQVFLDKGAFTGDLLVIDKAFVYGNSNVIPKADRIFRLQKSEDYKVPRIFVDANIDPDTKHPITYTSIAYSSDRNLLVTDTQNDKIWKFDQDGNSQGVFARMKKPNRIAVDHLGRVYITSQYEEAFSPIVILSPEGKKIGQIDGFQKLVPITFCPLEK